MALYKGMMSPVNYLTVKPPTDVAVIKPIMMDAGWVGIPPAVFSHKTHVQWLDCNNCHLSSRHLHYQEKDDETLFHGKDLEARILRRLPPDRGLSHG